MSMMRVISKPLAPARMIKSPAVERIPLCFAQVCAVGRAFFCLGAGELKRLAHLNGQAASKAGKLEPLTNARVRVVPLSRRNPEEPFTVYTPSSVKSIDAILPRERRYTRKVPSTGSEGSAEPARQKQQRDQRQR